MSVSADAKTLTQLLHRWSEGDSAAGDQIMPLVYDTLLMMELP